MFCFKHCCGFVIQTANELQDTLLICIESRFRMHILKYYNSFHALCVLVLGKHLAQMWTRHLNYHPQKEMLLAQISKWVERSYNILGPVMSESSSFCLQSLSYRKEIYWQFCFLPAFSAASCQSRALPMGRPGSCGLHHHTPAHKGHLHNGRYHTAQYAKPCSLLSS